MSYNDKYYGYGVVYSDSLYHHGIRGMKWGEKNGPPYPLADKLSARIKKRAEKKAEKKAKKDARRREKALRSTDPNYVYKNRDVLSDKELRDRTNRIQTEQQLKNLRTKNLPQKAVDTGAKVAKDVVVEAGKDELKKQIVKPLIAAGVSAVVGILVKRK